MMRVRLNHCQSYILTRLLTLLDFSRRRSSPLHPEVSHESSNLMILIVEVPPMVDLWVVLLVDQWVVLLVDQWAVLLVDQWVVLLVDQWVVLLVDQWVVLLVDQWAVLLVDQWVVLLVDQWVVLLVDQWVRVRVRSVKIITQPLRGERSWFRWHSSFQSLSVEVLRHVFDE
jgi:hypothetical protein